MALSPRIDDRQQTDLTKDQTRTDPPSLDPWRVSWRDFASRCERRMISGHQEYGGRSYSAHPIELIGELQQELLDVASWASILWDRLQRMKHAASGAIDE